MDGEAAGPGIDFPAEPSAETRPPSLLVPDLWQQEAIRALFAGRDVVVDAPTGAGKTFVFEKFVEKGASGQAVYTVPTRALANDKLMEWRTRGWNVGIATGDLAENLRAPVVVATLETQRHALLRGEGPDLLVIDEFQMLNDPLRGLHYELAIASAPPGTQLLLLSGSTANPDLIVGWLERLGRRAALVQCHERPVPQEEVDLEALRQKVPSGVRGHWPRRIAKALAAGLGPILVFAPRRQAAEDIARRLAAGLPPCEPLELTSAQSALARGTMRKLLARRIAFHHSGLDYPLRAGVIEPLAKKGQLRVIVATTGLAAGINFSMRSVLVAETHYRFGEELRRIRSDELLQMFGRAGRRGIDTVGYVLTGPDKPRLRDGRSVELAPNRRIDWQACLTTLQAATAAGEDPREALSALNQRFLSGGRLNLGLDDEMPLRFSESLAENSVPGKQRLVEMRNPDGDWERLGKKRRIALGKALYFSKGKWLPATSAPQVLQAVRHGTLCRLSGGCPVRYGRLLTLAVFPREEHKRHLDLTKRFRKLLFADWKEHRDFPRPGWHCSLEVLEKQYLPLLPRITGGGEPTRWEEHDGTVRVYLDYAKAVAFCRIDVQGRSLINPPVRESRSAETTDLKQALGNRADDKPRRPARNWADLGLVDSRFRPTRRGVIFSFFSQGEGLAIAAGLEDDSFAVGEMVFQLANLRAGHRFEECGNADGRLGDLSRLLYGWRTIPGYLKRGVPTEYGEGAAEIVAALVEGRRAGELQTGQLHVGDMERAMLEWRSILRQIVLAPDFAWDRWLELREEAWRYLERLPPATNLDNLPPLASHQTRRLEYR